MLRLLRLLASAGIALLVLSTVARAEAESPLVRAGVAAYEALDYPRAVSLLRRARKERLTIEELTVTLQTLGSAEVALGDEPAARADFEALVRLAPGLRMERTTSPRIRLVFEEARAKVLGGEAEAPEPTGPAEPPTPTPPATPTPSPPVERATPAPPSLAPLPWSVDPPRPVAGARATIRLAPPRDAARVDLSTRTAGQAEFRLRTLYPTGGPNLEVRIAGDELAAPRLELFAIALSTAGGEIARAGSPAAPIGVDVEAHAVPVYGRPWFWGVAGGISVVAATVVAVILLTRSSDGRLVVVPR